MNQDLPRDERYPVLRPAVIRTQGGRIDATCTNLGLSGGFLCCDWEPELGQVLEVAIQPRRASREDVELLGRVVVLSRAGGPERRGFGLRWIEPNDPKPLATLVNWARNMAARGAVDGGAAVRETVLDPLEGDTGPKPATGEA